MVSDNVTRRIVKRYYGVPGSYLRYQKGGLFSFLWHVSPKYLLLNISEMGLSFMTREPLREGQALASTIYAPQLSRPIRARGRVVWAQEVPEVAAWQVGVEFMRLNGRNFSRLKGLLGNAVLDSIKIAPHAYFDESAKL